MVARRRAVAVSIRVLSVGGITPLRCPHLHRRSDGAMDHFPKADQIRHRGFRLNCRIWVKPDRVHIARRTRLQERNGEGQVEMSQPAGANPGSRIPAPDRGNCFTKQCSIRLRIRLRFPEPRDIWFIPDFISNPPSLEVRRDVLRITRKRCGVFWTPRHVSAVIGMSIAQNDKGAEPARLDGVRRSIHGSKTKLAIALHPRPSKIHAHKFESRVARRIQRPLIAQQVIVHAQARPKLLRTLRSRRQRSIRFEPERRRDRTHKLDIIKANRPFRRIGIAGFYKNPELRDFSPRPSVIVAAPMSGRSIRAERDHNLPPLILLPMFQGEWVRVELKRLPILILQSNSNRYVRRAPGPHRNRRDLPRFDARIRFPVRRHVPAAHTRAITVETIFENRSLPRVARPGCKRSTRTRKFLPV